MPGSKDLNTMTRENTLQQMQDAFKENNFQQASELFMRYNESVCQDVRRELEQLKQTNGDNAVLQSRGVRILTQTEKKYYEKVIEASKSPDYKQQLSNVEMPFSIIEDVFKNLVDEHPLLARINFTNVQFLTKWVLNDHTVQTAVWGEINTEITQEISSSFRTVELEQFKLSAFFILDNAMLELGPTYIDAYVRRVLADSISVGLEKAIVTGDGKKCPLGMDRDIHEGVTVTGGVYPRKTPLKVTSFLPKEYGKVLSNMTKTEKGKARKFSKVLMVVNMNEYLTKIMPATTVLNGAGAYVNNLFPFPTDVEISNEVADGEAIVCIPEEYFFGLGMASKIEYSDEVKFLEDQRAYRAKLHGNGRMSDNTCSLLLDISKLDPAYITVKQLSDAVEGA